MKKKILITSGPTVEPIDPVRYLSNRSSGKTGFHIAEECKRRGIGDITFITGPSVHIPGGMKVVQVQTAMEMREEANKYFDECDVLIMSAAVSDYSCAKYYPEKLKKKMNKFNLSLVKNPDILFELGRKKKGQFMVGFAAETENIFENAQEKLSLKNLDLIVLNEISDKNTAFDVDTNQVYFVTNGKIEKYDKMKKSEIAVKLWDYIENILSDG